jgi:hypothetical protein
VELALPVMAAVFPSSACRHLLPMEDMGRRRLIAKVR